MDHSFEIKKLEDAINFILCDIYSWIEDRLQLPEEERVESRRLLMKVAKKDSETLH
uniref:Uncharacterized protein n=1 Tax=viral metagenome TaxID=1070528 RepID=A0A6M3Y021_9ZZZZ